MTIRGLKLQIAERKASLNLAEIWSNIAERPRRASMTRIPTHPGT